jgi:predicted DNA-binding transcriptional regulator AlpA
MGNTKESYAGAFPRRIQLGPNRVCWVGEGVEAWLRERTEDRGTA